MEKYWTTTSTGFIGGWLTTTSWGKIPVNYIIKKKK